MINVKLGHVIVMKKRKRNQHKVLLVPVVVKAIARVKQMEIQTIPLLAVLLVVVAVRAVVVIVVAIVAAVVAAVALLGSRSGTNEAED